MRGASHSLLRPGRIAAAAWKRARHLLEYKLAYLRAEKNGDIYFFPEKPHPYTAVFRTLHLNGIRIIGGLPLRSKQSAVLFFWEDSTWSQHQIPELSPDCRVINRRCIDISKATVGELQQAVFGYRAEVDPRKHAGPMVKKSDENGEHSGEVVCGPLQHPEPKRVYQQVIDNRSQSLGMLSAGPDKVIDMRVPIFGTVRECAFVKYRSIDTRFSNANDLTEILPVDRLFSQGEVARLNEFCSRIGLDYGEIDVLRDAASSRIFVLDVNKTPLGPPNGLSQDAFREALRFYQKSFSSFLEAPLD